MNTTKIYQGFEIPNVREILATFESASIGKLVATRDEHRTKRNALLARDDYSQRRFLQELQVEHLIIIEETGRHLRQDYGLAA